MYMEILYKLKIIAKPVDFCLLKYYNIHIMKNDTNNGKGGNYELFT